MPGTSLLGLVPRLILLLALPLLGLRLPVLKVGAHLLPATQVYYVAPSGDNSNDGSQAHPFATIQQAATVVTPGSMVHVLPGIYADPVTVTTSGTADARITFLSDVRWGAKIHT